MKIHLLYICSLAIIFCGCGGMYRFQNDSGHLSSIDIVSRDGFSETITNKERLKQYVTVDFLKNQPYQKVMRVYSRDREGDIHAYITSYHLNGQPHQYLEIVNGRASGTYQEWFPNGALKIEVQVIGGTADILTTAEKTWLFNGCAKVWNEDGALIAEIPYCRGMLDGESVYYHASGGLWKIIPFHQGKLEGSVQIFQKDGQLFQTTEYVKGKKHGLSKRYWNCEQMASEEIYKQGLLANGRYYKMSGELIARIDDGFGYRALFGKSCVIELQQYQRGVQEGEAKIYNTEERLVRLYHFKDDNLHGEEIYYYDQPTLEETPPKKLSIMWNDGKMQGMVKTWYANGDPESQREMGNNQKNGIAIAWYYDGNVMFIEEYEHNKIIKGEYYSKGERFPASRIDSGKGMATLFDLHGNYVRKVSYLNGAPED